MMAANFPGHPSHSTTRRHPSAKFGDLSEGFGRIATGYTQPIDPYREFRGKFQYSPPSSEESSELSSENLGRKKALENLGLSECYQFCSLS
jgi:hypothetical protein